MQRLSEVGLALHVQAGRRLLAPPEVFFVSLENLMKQSYKALF
jgi:hypothetical protein